MTSLTPELLLRAYMAGVFPMAEDRDDPNLYWIDPERRGILPLDGFHLPRRLRRTMRQSTATYSIDRAFGAVIEGCASANVRRPTTWINSEIVRLYTGLFDRGHAHSVEIWLDDALVGGLYGVSIGGAFFGESMFSRERDTSKFALVHLVVRLRAGGFELLDTQFITDHLRRFGTLEIPRDQYHRRLAHALSQPANFSALVDHGRVADVLQSMTHTS
ncbi:MAG: leucyl/phenylalanyl-tRNA--protein transferase [Alphaproteobacteria bacterium]|nr:leucyl/phenylalanyl-tRNA--protein transferase [Alphaproteobacteria bacterium]